MDINKVFGTDCYLNEVFPVFFWIFFYDNMGVAITVTVLHEQGQKDNIQAWHIPWEVGMGTYFDKNKA